MRILLLAFGWLGASMSTGCTLAAFNASVRFPPLYRGTDRTAILKELGAPGRSRSFHPAVAGNTFAQPPEALRLARVSLYDEYQVNGLVMTPDHYLYREYTEGYLTMMYLTLGVAELYYFPYTTADLAKHAKERYQLRLWYDGAGHLLAEDDRPARTDATPDQAPRRTVAGRSAPGDHR